MLNFATGATVAAVLAAAGLVFGLRGASSVTSGWALVGFAAMALPVIATGAFLAHEQGHAGASFVVVLGAGLLMRAVFLTLVVAGALRQDTAALLGALVGLAVGFVPVTAFELVWFARRVHGEPRHAERRA